MSNVQHHPTVNMTDDQAQAFPDADFVIAVRLPRDDHGHPARGAEPTHLFVHAAPSFTVVPDTVMAGRDAVTENDVPLQLRPEPHQILKTVNLDNTMAVCTNRPYWRWVNLTLTQL